MSATHIFRPEKLPSLSRIPKELGREERRCERCNRRTEHILYRVPKRVAGFFYIREHPQNLHATCVACARSTVLIGEDRERALASLEKS